MRTHSLIGRTVADRFTITRFLGEGGMATVFVAEQDREPREVALKIMNEELTADRSFVKRFQREAKAAATVQHPNSVAFIDYGVADGISYIAMELLSGDDLYVLLERDGAITQGRAARIVAEVCDALSVAHELGIVHRDLKPENIMVVPDRAAPHGERVKVLDFGIAKLVAPDTQPANHRIDPPSGVTRAGTFIGTPAYMSPEQCALLAVDSRADLYTCGVLLFQMTTGRLPFEGQTPLHTATLHIHEPAPNPRAYAPTLDPRLEALIMKALAKAPDGRQQTAAELGKALRALLADMPDVRVATVGKPAPGSLRGRTRNSAAASMARAPSSSDLGMESAKTMVAGEGGGESPSVRLGRGAGPASDPVVTPQRIRPAAGAPAPRARAPSIEEPAIDSDDDFSRTLVRAPLDDEAAPRFGPQNTEVIHATVDAIESDALGGAPTPKTSPPPAGNGAPPVDVPAPRKPVTSGNAPVRPLPPRPPKPTLKSAADFKLDGPQAAPAKPKAEPVTSGSPAPQTSPAKPALVKPPLVKPAPQEFKLGSGGAKLGAASAGSRPLSASPLSASPPSSPSSSSDEITVTPILAIHRPDSLGSMRLGAAKLATPAVEDAQETERSRASDLPDVPNVAKSADETSGETPVASVPVSLPASLPSPPRSLQQGGPLSGSVSGQVVVTPMGFGETTRMDVRDPALQIPGRAGPALGTAATVPMISPALVAAVIAQGPPGAPAGPRQASTEVQPRERGGTAPMLAQGMPVAPMAHMPPPPAPPPQTPPIYPLAQAGQASRLSGARGLLVGFLGGAVLMALVALIYVALR